MAPTILLFQFSDLFFQRLEIECAAPPRMRLNVS